ncbi:hypothetical protein BCV70DRAFT_238879 [Testicularia cyperi]|uniref:Nucleolar pre-ribosomal-associated protein 1 C-terminal domain-containing protein n=1 Tax=Testicularia cyperi TaxID=1882483 RepID=A0A317XKH9_9BASI|nr:hypothetical protein BCV70DRAFT_238879 [Testicularia cyperi]
MVDKRKRAASDAASLSHSSASGSSDIEVDEQDPVKHSSVQGNGGPSDGGNAKQQQSNGSAVSAATAPRLAPFASGAELHQALKTPSADLLRLLLSRYRAQTTLSFAEDTQRSSIPASDKRIELVKDYCQLCESEATNSANTASTAARALFSTWELADKQNLATLLHLPIFSLAQTLALLSIHFPTQALGEAIIERILSPNEPWFAMLQNYIAHLGGAKYAPPSTSRDPSSKGTDVAALASLVLLREVTSFARGRFAGKVFDSFNWSIKVLPHIFTMRRRTQKKSKSARKSIGSDSRGTIDASLRRPDIRTLYILFLLSFLQQTYSSSLKTRLLDLGRDFLPAMLKGLPQDPADVVQIILLHLHEDLVKDERISRTKKVEFWNEWACECVVKLYARQDDHVLVHTDDSNTEESPSVAELAHHFLLSICTNPGFGICYPDRGWYPRKSDRDDAALAVDPNLTVDALVADDTHVNIRESSSSGKKGQQQSGSVHNKVLSGVLRQLAVTEDLLQQELALSILQACPELVGPYLESSCAGLSVDPRPSSRWLCNIAFFGRVVGLELPSFRNAKVERVEAASELGRSAAGSSAAYLEAYPTNPPPMATVLSNVVPSPFHRFLFAQGLASSDRLVRYSTCALLCRCLDRMAQFRAVCEDAIATLDEGSEGPWRRRLQALEIEARKRLPDISTVIQILQMAIGNAGAANGRASTVGLDDESVDGAPSQADAASNALSIEVALRLLWLFYLAVPSSAYEVRFNAGKLLTNSFMRTSAVRSKVTVEKSPKQVDGSSAAGEDEGMEDDQAEEAEEEEDEEEDDALNLQALCQVHTLRILSLSSEAAFDWTAKASTAIQGGVSTSYLGALLSIYVSTPLDQVRDACEELLRKILTASALFEHNTAELDAWLASLPHADSLQASASNNSKDAESIAGVVAQLSEEQSSVVTFLDECVLRCMKTPYRYIEAARQYLADHRNSIAASADTATELAGHVVANPSASSDLLASPLLMVIVEQFTIRAQKGLLNADFDVVGALLAFFGRLLPGLAAYTLNTAVLKDIANDIRASIDSNETYARSAYSAKVIVSRLTAIGTAPRTRASISPIQSTDAIFSTGTYAALRRSLRGAPRPLPSADVKQLYDCVVQLSSKGLPRAAEILDELDPQQENLCIALGDATFVKPSSIPLLHLSQACQISDTTDRAFMSTQEEESVIVPWTTNVACRMAVLTAVARVREQALAAPALSNAADDVQAQSESILRHLVVASGCLDDPAFRRFVFAEAAPLAMVIPSSLGNASAIDTVTGFLRTICTLVADLDTSIEESSGLLTNVITALLSETIWAHASRKDLLASVTHVAPFVDETTAAQIVDRLLSASSADKSTDFALLVETLHVLLALFPNSDIVPARVAEHMDLIAKTFAGSASASPETQGLASSLLHELLHRSANNREALPPALAKAIRPLLQFSTPNHSQDGVLSMLVQLRQDCAIEVVESQLRCIRNSSSGENVVASLPFTVKAALEAGLLHDLQSSAWTKTDIDALLASSLSALKETQAIHEDTAVRVAIEAKVSCFTLSSQYAEKRGWQDASRTAFEAVVAHLADCTPQQAFTEGLLILVRSCVRDLASVPGVNKFVQAIIDQALLWLVRRFAEDLNDHRSLVGEIRIFTLLLQNTFSTEARASQLGVQLKPHLVDPVVQAAIKNRLLALEQMELVSSLCKHASLSTGQLSRYLGAISAHSEFGTVMRGQATALLPLTGDDTDDVDENDDEQKGATGGSDDAQDKHKQSLRLKELLIQTIHSVASRDPRGLLQSAFMAKLMSFYNATLCSSDRLLLDLFRRYEEVGGHSFASLAMNWTLPSSKLGGGGSGGGSFGNQADTMEALLSLDSNMVFATCTEYPRDLPLARTDKSGYGARADVLVLPGQIFGKHTDAEQRYDPTFLTALLAGAISERKPTGLEWLSILATNVPGLVVCGLSSRWPEMRRASWSLLALCYARISEVSFQEKEHLLMIFDLLRNAASSNANDNEEDGDDFYGKASGSAEVSAPYLPVATTLFITHALRAVASPASFVYPSISHFMLQRPELDIGDVPLLYNLLYSASDRYRQERIWMLRFLRDVARSGGRSDWKIFKRRHTWELLVSLYDSCQPAAGAGSSASNAERAGEDAAIRAMVEDTTYWLARHEHVASQLVSRRGILTWIWQQLVREGVVSIADSPDRSDTAKAHRSANVNQADVTVATTAFGSAASGSTASTSIVLRNTWLLLTAQLVQTADLDRLDRATEGMWRASVLSIVETSLRAVDKVQRRSTGSNSSQSGGSQSLGSVTTSTAQSMVYAAAVILEKLIWHSSNTSNQNADGKAQETEEPDSVPQVKDAHSPRLSYSSILVPTYVAAVSTAFQIARRWLESVDASLDFYTPSTTDRAKKVKDARKTCVRLQRCILGLEKQVHPTESRTVSKLAHLLRQSVQICKRFDQETHHLLLSTVYQTSSAVQ